MSKPDKSLKDRYQSFLSNPKAPIEQFGDRVGSEMEPPGEGVVKYDTPFQKDQALIKTLLKGDTVFDDASLHNPDLKQTKVIRFLTEEFTLCGKKDVLILGDVGAGKTWGALAYMVNQAGFFHPSMAFITAYDLSYLVSKREWDTLEKITRKKYLLIDDLGTEPSSFKGKDFIAHFENLFSERHRYLKYTLMTSNASIEQIKEVYGERFISRLRESGKIFETDDPDLRRSL